MADFNSKYSGEQVEQLLDMVAGGNAGSGGATALQYYVTTFGLNDLLGGEDLFQEQVDKVNLLAAIRANKLILMPQETSTPEVGFIVLACYIDDFLYINFTDGGRAIHIETVVNNPDIYTSEISITTYTTLDDVGNAIAEAITNVINASY